MKRAFAFTSVAVLFFAATTFAQQPPAAGQKIGIATSLQRGYANLKMNFTQAAEKMSEADYSFKPGSTPEARTFAQVIAHIAQAQFGQCSGVKGVPNPMQGKNLEQELKTKAEVTKALADSFAICDDAFASTTDANAIRDHQARGRTKRPAPRRSTACSCTATRCPAPRAVYLRSKNLVPPSTERASQGRGRGQN